MKKGIKIFLIATTLMLILLQSLSLNANNNIEVKITFQIAGGDATTIPTTLMLAPYSELDLNNLTNPTRSGYTFSGWLYEGELLTSNMFIVPEKNTTLVAQWQGIAQTIQFETGLTNVSDVPISKIMQTGAWLDLQTLSTPTHTRYIFSCWQYLGQCVNTGLVVPNNNIILVAKWAGSTEMITFVGNAADVQNVPTSLQLAVGTELNIKEITTPKRTGYQFVGWKIADTFVDMTYTVKEGGATLTAVWNDLATTLSLSAEKTSVTIEATTDVNLNFTTLFGMTASDSATGDLTEKIHYNKTIRRYDQVGTYTIEATIHNEQQQRQTVALELNIVDTTPPNMTVDQTEITLKIGDSRALDIAKLFNLQIKDVVSKNNITTNYIYSKPIAIFAADRYEITINTSDELGNQANYTLKLILEPIMITGTVFKDTVANSLFATNQGIAGITLNLIDAQDKKIIETITTDEKGQYAFYYPNTTNNISSVTNHNNLQVCANISSDMVIATPKKTTTASKFEPATKCTKPLNIMGEDLHFNNLGLHENVNVFINNNAITLIQNEVIKLDILINNGTIATVTIQDETIGDVWLQENGVFIIAKNQGVTNIQITFYDKYYQESSVRKEVILTVQ